jgi:SAM-dependent methyltransferase
MIEIANERAAVAGANIDFTVGDIRTLTWKREFDLVTCWYDSLNYLLESDDLRETFGGAARALKPGGVFIFDMNSLFGLAKVWREAGCYVRDENSHIFELHRHDYDFETDIGSVLITCFIKENGCWTRFDEEHRERAYPHQEILKMLRDTGLQTIAAWGSFRDRSEVTPESGRIWYISRKGMG